MNNLKNKLTSRKFILALSGVITGIMLIATGNTTEGTTTLVTSIITYLISEGYIDAKAVNSLMRGDEDEDK